jgi:phenylalanyl-tRNA synthetase beta chain
MKIPLDWLGEWCDWSESSEELADRLTRSGTEVISIHSTGSKVKGVVSAKILEKKQHPNADRLTVCLVDDGSGPRQVVCGAKNHNAGDIVPLAKPGTTFPDGMTIKSAKLRGESSEGMLCSAKELGLAEDAEGLLLLPSETKLGVPLEQIFPGETIFEVEITSNRPDLASVEGVARELSALGISRKNRAAITKAPDKALSGWKVRVTDEKDCPHYTLTALDVRPDLDSPDWMKKRLASCGLKSRGLLVDATNYVMLEIGQPLHVFDAERLDGKTIEIRRSKAGEKLSGLDGGAHLLTAEDLVIADEKGPVALAGVVGGETSSVQKNTRKILLESGSFQAGRIRKTARRLSLTTDSARCFGRGGLDPSLVEQGRDRFVQLLTECGAIEKYEGSVVVGAVPAVSRQSIPLRMERLQKILGLKMDPKVLATKLTALGFREEEGCWLAPSWRADVREEIDLIEELIRVEDLDKVPVVLDALAEGQVNEDKADRQRRQIRAFLVERGFFEVLSGSLVRMEEGKSVSLYIAASPDASGYRESLVPNLLRIAARNISRGQGDLKLFEIGRVMGKGSKEEIRLAMLVAGRERPVHWEEGESKADLFSLKGLWQELRERFDGLAEVGVPRETDSVEKKSAGLKAATWVLECALGTKERRPSEYREVSSFPGVQRDLALILPQEVPFADVEKAIRSAAPAEMEGLSVFDRFRDASGVKVPKGFLSLGCRLQFRSTARTLTEQEVSGWEKKILESLATRCQARLRGVL